MNDKESGCLEELALWIPFLKEASSWIVRGHSVSHSLLSASKFRGPANNGFGLPFGFPLKPHNKGGR